MNPLLSGKKKSLLAIIGGNIDNEDDNSNNKMDNTDEADAMDAGQADAEKAAAKMLMVAIKNNNPEALIKAFKNLMDVCDSMDSMDNNEQE